MVACPPLFVFEDNSLSIFDSVDGLQEKLEPIDVQNHVYQVFDANGSTVELSVVHQEKDFLKIFKSNVATVEVSNIIPCDQDILIEKLKYIYMLHYKNDVGNMTLKQLQNSLIDLYGFTI